ncbi:Crp/Fnr family transcriptional regulator [Candidatus Leptofilum sp.]|uniref:Crp/Fnr family transcriptional regulator n=1 Tax=Candidatus Leptofilum sp. TaxID=3241576 RepID=UPI003B5BDA90
MFSQATLQIPPKPELFALMKTSTLFKSLDDSAIKAIYEAGVLEKFRKDSFIFHQDEPAKTISILVHGVVHLSQLTVKGQQVIMHYLAPGDEMGILALFPDQVYPVTAVSAADCLLLSWPDKILAALIKQFPQLALNALQMMTNRFVVLQNQYRQLATERAEQRIARTLLQIAQKSGKNDSQGSWLSPPPSRQQVAEMTGTTLYTVSRICSKWEKEGIIVTSRKWLQIKKYDTLQVIIEDGSPLSQ